MKLEGAECAPVGLFVGLKGMYCCMCNPPSLIGWVVEVLTCSMSGKKECGTAAMFIDRAGLVVELDSVCVCTVLLAMPWVLLFGCENRSVCMSRLFEEWYLYWLQRFLCYHVMEYGECCVL